MRLWYDGAYWLLRDTVSFIVNRLDSNDYPPQIISELSEQTDWVGVSSDVLTMSDDDYDRYAFACRYSSTEAIDWIGKQQWLLDFQAALDFRKSEMLGKIYDSQSALQQLKADFDRADFEFRKAHFMEQRAACAKQEHYTRSLINFSQCQSCTLRPTFPMGYALPPKQRSTFIRRIFARV